MKAVALVVLLLIASPVAAQVGTEPGAWAPEHRDRADTIGTYTVYGQIVADVIASARAQDRSHAFADQACRVGVAGGLAFGLKTLLPETRPDGSDNHSCCSAHTAIAVASAGWRYQFSLPVAAWVGYSRVAANKHHWKDVGVGALIGVGAQLACRGLVRHGNSFTVTGF